MQQIIVWIVVLGVILLVGIGMIFALRAPRTAPKTYPADKGLSFIDVSDYPQEMQTLYELFTNNVVDAIPFHVLLTLPLHRKNGENMCIR